MGAIHCGGNWKSTVQSEWKGFVYASNRPHDQVHMWILFTIGHTWFVLWYDFMRCDIIRIDTTQRWVRSHRSLHQTMRCSLWHSLRLGWKWWTLIDLMAQWTVYVMCCSLWVWYDMCKWTADFTRHERGYSAMHPSGTLMKMGENNGTHHNRVMGRSSRARSLVSCLDIALAI